MRPAPRAGEMTVRPRTPPETLLAALIGCTSRISHKIAAKHGVEIQDMAVDLEARFDRKDSISKSKSMCRSSPSR